MRNKIGLAAFILLICAVIEFVLRFYGYTESSKPHSGGMVRIGTVLFALWLAWPDLEMFPRWVLTASMPTALAVAYYPKLLFVVIPLILLMLFLQPKKPTAKKTQTPRTEIQPLPPPKKRSGSLSRSAGKLARSIFRDDSQKKSKKK